MNIHVVVGYKLDPCEWFSGTELQMALLHSSFATIHVLDVYQYNDQ